MPNCPHFKMSYLSFAPKIKNKKNPTFNSFQQDLQCAHYQERVMLTLNKQEMLDTFLRCSLDYSPLVKSIRSHKHSSHEVHDMKQQKTPETY